MNAVVAQREGADAAFVRTAAFMKEIGMLSKVPATIRDIELPHLKGAGD